MGPKNGHKYRLVNIANGTPLGLGEDHHCAVGREWADDKGQYVRPNNPHDVYLTLTTYS